MHSPSAPLPHLLIRLAIGLGSNLGESVLTVKNAFNALAKLACELQPDPKEKAFTLKQSSLYRSKAIDTPDLQPDYINAVLVVEYGVGHGDCEDFFESQPAYAYRWMNALQALEKKTGRQNKGDHLARTLDLDLLFINDWQINTADLILPHPQITRRKFVLAPLLEICPDLEIASMGQMAQYWKAPISQQLCDKIID